jgi:hypothetical protein
MFLMSILPAPAQTVVVQLPDIFVFSDNYSIHVSHKAGAHPSKVPVLLIHGSWGNAQTWNFPGRSVMDYLTVRGYDVYALDLRGMGESIPRPTGPADYFPIDIFGRVRDAAAVAGYIRNNTGRVPVVMGWSHGGIVPGPGAFPPDTFPGCARAKKRFNRCSSGRLCDSNGMSTRTGKTFASTMFDLERQSRFR